MFVQLATEIVAMRLFDFLATNYLQRGMCATPIKLHGYYNNLTKTNSCQLYNISCTSLCIILVC